MRLGTCELCRREDESGHNAVVLCPKARALRSEMRKHLQLPDELQFRYTGPDWLLTLLGLLDWETEACVLLLLWRAWHLRNDQVHVKGMEPIEGSARFLVSYAGVGDTKGKGKLFPEIDINDKKAREGEGTSAAKKDGKHRQRAGLRSTRMRRSMKRQERRVQALSSSATLLVK